MFPSLCSPHHVTQSNLPMVFSFLDTHLRLFVKMPRRKGQILVDETAEFYHWDARTQEWFGAMQYESKTINTKKSNLRALLTSASCRAGKTVGIDDLRLSDIIGLANAMVDAEYKPTTIQSRCSNVQTDLVGAGLGNFAEGNAMEVRRMDQLQRRLREVARRSDIKKAQLLFKHKVNDLCQNDQLRLALWCLSGFRMASWKALCSASFPDDAPAVLRSGKSKVLPWARPCCAIIGCNCTDDDGARFCPTHAWAGEKLAPGDLLEDPGELIECAGGTGHSARRTMAFWYRFVFENRKELHSEGVLNAHAIGKIKEGINLCMGWTRNSDMLWTTYSLDFNSHDPSEVFDLLGGAINSLNIALEVLGKGDHSGDLFLVDEKIAKEVLNNERFDPI